MRKFVFGLVLLLILTMALTGCGGSEPAAPAEQEAAPAEQEAAPAEPAESDEEMSEPEPVEEAEAEVDPNAPEPEPTPIVNAFGECDDPLILWHGLTGTDGAVFAEMLENYVNEVEGACLSSEGIPWDIFFQKYPTATAAGTPPDMVIFHAAEVGQMAAEGLDDAAR